MLKRLIASLALLAAAAGCTTLQSRTFSDAEGAIRGYDPVAYFTDGAPAQGSPEFTTTWDGAQWYFASAANRDRFIADPARYAPQYGGYCAWAVSQGYTASADPTVWAIVDDKLYVNYDKKVGATWQTDPAGFIEKADANWPRVLSD